MISFFVHQKLKKPPSKVSQNSSNPLFFLTALTAQTTQTEEFMFQNVAYWPTVYRIGPVLKISKKHHILTNVHTTRNTWTVSRSATDLHLSSSYAFLNGLQQQITHIVLCIKKQTNLWLAYSTRVPFYNPLWSFFEQVH